MPPKRTLESFFKVTANNKKCTSDTEESEVVDPREAAPAAPMKTLQSKLSAVITKHLFLNHQALRHWRAVKSVVLYPTVDIAKKFFVQTNNAKDILENGISGVWVDKN